MRKSCAFLSFGLACVLGVALPSFAGSEAEARPGSIHPITAQSWSFECVDSSSCGSDGQWITTKSQPGTVRLWDSGTAWAVLHTGPSTYNWTKLDTWLDMIAQHQPMTVIFTFGHVPCFIATIACSQGQYWSGSIPKDLNANGSQTFTNFVTALTKHCSPAGHCVKNYIKMYEVWNEPSLSHYWNGTVNQLYDLFRPAATIIHTNVPGAIISTPPISGGNTNYISSWLSLENTNGRLSNYYGFHSYLSGYEPETRFNMVVRMVTAKNNAGWTTTPWMNSETNFEVGSDVCTSSVEDCEGQLVRWHVLQFAYQGGSGGAGNVGWYNWPSIKNYDTFYYTMMQWLIGGNFTTSCSTSGTVYTCPFNEGNGHSALIVWDSNGTSRYTPATQYVDYKEFNGTYGGATVNIQPGQLTNIGLIPIMFEN